MTGPALVQRHPLIDDVLDAWSEALGALRPAYGGHAYRVYNIARRLAPSSRLDDELAVASAFHDLGIWSDGTFDYLDPSIARAVAYLQPRAAAGAGPSPELVARLIDNHHRLFPIRGEPHAETIEAFRKADLIDVSVGLVRDGVDRGFLRELSAAFPRAGFHGAIARAALSWIVKHPLRPLPMVRL